MKRLITAIIAAFMLAAPVCAEVLDPGDNSVYDWRERNFYYKTAESFLSGDGTEDDPYLISSWEEFNLINEYGCGDRGAFVHFKLTQDLEIHSIDIRESSGWLRWTGVKTDRIARTEPFEGILDGAGHLIIPNNPDSKLGIFEVIGKNGIVKNLKVIVNSGNYNGNALGGIADVNDGLIENCKAMLSTDGSQINGKNIGGIVGENHGKIMRCSAVSREGDFDFRLKESGAGGICGYNNGGEINECYAAVNIHGEKKSSRAVGGIAGDSTNGIIRNCFVRAQLANEGSETGGIAGRLNGGVVENCLATCGMRGAWDYAGMLAGRRFDDPQIKNCYFQQNSYQGKRPNFGDAREEDSYYGHTEAELLNQATYEGWDFDGIWASNGLSCPVLRWQYSYSDIAEHWSRDMVQKLSENSILSGYEDSTFHPNDKVTKAEFIKMVTYVSDSDDSFGIPYTDVPDWAVPYVKSAYHSGMLENIELSGDTLGANEPITRLEAGVIAGRKWMQFGEDVKFTDMEDIPDWAVKPLGHAVYYKFIKGYEDGSFRPNNTLTRAEAASMIYNNLKKNNHI